jgi:hypothetical protein
MQHAYKSLRMASGRLDNPSGRVSLEVARFDLAFTQPVGLG